MNMEIDIVKLVKGVHFMAKVKICSFCGNDGTKQWLCRECPIDVINNKLIEVKKI